MNNYLIYRTDRIGDFLVSCILINNIKRNDPNSFITAVCSEKNYNYILEYELVDSVVVYKKNIFSYFLNLYKLNKKRYNFTIIHDEKDRSKVLNFFIRNDKTISIEKKQPKSKIQIIKNIIYKLGFNYSEIDLNILDIKANLLDTSKGDYIVFHYDEKWSNSTYPSNYINIEPNLDELISFIKQLEQKLKLKIIVTTGSCAPKNLIKLASSNYFNNVEISLNQSFFDLEKIIFNSKLLISCHGSVSHIAASKKIPQIDIIDKSYDYSVWTSHFRNYNCVFRKNFEELSLDILNSL